MNKTTLYLPEETHRRLRETARRTGRPQAELIREALEGYLAAEPAPIPSSIGSGSDRELSGAGTEDWLRFEWRAESRRR